MLKRLIFISGLACSVFAPQNLDAVKVYYGLPAVKKLLEIDDPKHMAFGDLSVKFLDTFNCDDDSGLMYNPGFAPEQTLAVGNYVMERDSSGIIPGPVFLLDSRVPCRCKGVAVMLVECDHNRATTDAQRAAFGTYVDETFFLTNSKFSPYQRELLVEFSTPRGPVVILYTELDEDGRETFGGPEPIPAQLVRSASCGCLADDEQREMNPAMYDGHPMGKVAGLLFVPAARTLDEADESGVTSSSSVIEPGSGMMSIRTFLDRGLLGQGSNHIPHPMHRVYYGTRGYSQYWCICFNGGAHRECQDPDLHYPSGDPALEGLDGAGPSRLAIEGPPAGGETEGSGAGSGEHGGSDQEPVAENAEGQRSDPSDTGPEGAESKPDPKNKGQGPCIVM